MNHVQYVYIGNCVALSSEYVRATVKKRGQSYAVEGLKCKLKSLDFINCGKSVLKIMQ